jgi:proteasome subunit B (beta)-like protein
VRPADDSDRERLVSPLESEYPEPVTGEQVMTLCIAAECNEAGDSAIVLCRDWQAQKGSVTSDDADKEREVDEGGLGCRVLLAGSPTRADHLLTTCEPAIREFMRKNSPTDTDIDTDKLLQDLRVAAKLVRRELINGWVATTLNMEFDDFRKHGRNELLESHYHDVWETIRRYDIGAELLITLYDADEDAVIIRTDGLGEVFWETDYSIIGTGGEIARAFLCQVDYDPSKMSVGDCIYEVLRAKFAAENSREVGAGTTVKVTAKGKKDRVASLKGFDYYKGLLLPYRTPKLEFDSSFLEDADLENEASSKESEKPSIPPESSGTLGAE